MQTEIKRLVSYEIREIDEAGDAVNNPWFEEGRGAKARILQTFGGLDAPDEFVRAYVLERVVSKISDADGVVDRDYEVLAVKGDHDALAAGDWVVGGVS